MRRWVNYMTTEPSSEIFKVVWSLQNFGYDAPYSSRFDRLSNPLQPGIKKIDRGRILTVYPAPEKEGKGRSEEMEIASNIDIRNE